MNSDNLTLVAVKLCQFQQELKTAYDAAVKSHQQFAEILLHGMLEDTEKMQHRLGRIIDACIIQENCAEEGE
jgi:hypothetical protein